MGKFLRKTSLDELPQIINILKGDMSIVGPRPALWNQYDLIAERDKYGANEIKPGLTGWAQINGRDELPNEVKAKLDGEYTQRISLGLDLKVFCMTILSVLKSDGVREGAVSTEAPQHQRSLVINGEKRILITGKGSYVGTSFINWVKQWPEQYEVEELSVRGEAWREHDFSVYDVVLHVAGIAHVSTDPSMEQEYYRVNRDLTIEVARKAKQEKVKQFIFMSSIIVYEDNGRVTLIDSDTPANPSNFYGRSKLQAEKGIRGLEEEKFKIAILRPPMIYGKDSKGNYRKMARISRKIRVFPDFYNKRSMLHIDNLCELLRLIINNEDKGFFYPQNKEYSSTTEMVRLISLVHGNKIHFTKMFNPVMKITVKKISIFRKIFGDLIYDQKISVYKENYQIRTLKESIKLSEIINRNET